MSLLKYVVAFFVIIGNMNAVSNVLLLIHIACGMTALGCGLIPMLSRKGSTLHRVGGRWYVWSMWGVVFSALPLSIMKQNLFLGTIAIFTAYMIYSGYRSAIRNTVVPQSIADLLMMGLALLSGAIMISYGSWLLLGPSGKTGMGIILLVFGTITFLLGVEDLGHWKKRAQESQKSWMLVHLSRFGGAYIATITAFLVTNVEGIPSLVLWLPPTLIGTVAIARSSRKWTPPRKSTTNK